MSEVRAAGRPRWTTKPRGTTQVAPGRQERRAGAATYEAAGTGAGAYEGAAA